MTRVSSTSIANDLPYPSCETTYFQGNPADPECAGSQMVWDPVDGYVVLYMVCLWGWLVFHSCTWKFQGGEWTNITDLGAPCPPPMVGETFVWDTADGYALLFGGLNYQPGSRGAEDPGTWAFVKGAWSNLTASPAPRPFNPSLPISAFDSSDHEVLALWQCYSCSRGNQSFLWSYTGGTWSNISALLPPDPVMTWQPDLVDDPSDHGVLFFGGSSLVGPGNWTSSSWIFSGGSWHNATGSLEPPSFRTPSLGYDPMDGYVLFTGGNAQGCGVNACFVQGLDWTFADGSWTNITNQVTGSQPYQTAGKLVADVADGYMIEGFGQVSSASCTLTESPYCDTQTSLYEYRAGHWSVIGPSPRSSNWFLSTEATILYVAVVAVVAAIIVLLRRRRRSPREEGLVPPSPQAP